MLFVAEITNAAARRAALDYLHAHEAFARMFAAQCAAGAVVQLGPMQQRDGASTFQLRVAGDEMLVAATVIVTPGMPEAEVWSTWFMTLDIAGLNVRADARYEAFCFAELDRMEA